MRRSVEDSNGIGAMIHKQMPASWPGAGADCADTRPRCRLLDVDTLGISALTWANAEN